MKTKTISILGSTGSIGRQTLDVVDGLGIQVAALAAHSGVSRLEEQCRRFRPKLAVLADETAAADLKVRLAGTETKVLGGAGALCEAATLPEADTVLSSVVGMAGLKPTLAAIRERKRIALANKETLAGTSWSASRPNSPKERLYHLAATPWTPSLQRWSGRLRRAPNISRPRPSMNRRNSSSLWRKQNSSASRFSSGS